MQATYLPVRDLIERELDDVRAIRHDLHAHPELMFEERRTSGVVCRELGALGIEHRAGYGAMEQGGDGTGVVGFLPATGASRKTVGLRADMDALPILEQTGKPYASTVPGTMHACGHDAHTSILIGAARVLAKLEERPNNITFVFQPAEEGGSGGEKMCRDGALAGEGKGGLGTPVNEMFGLHGWTGMRVGHIGTRPGPLLAATDDFIVTVRGKGGHAAMPHLCTDALLAGTAIVQALQQIASRITSPVDSVVCTVARFEGGTVSNIIPETVEFEGTIRTLRDETRKEAEQRFREIVDLTARAYGVEAEIDFIPGYPVTRNNPEVAARVIERFDEAFGRDSVERVPDPFMGGEDFSYYGLHVPACFYLLGLLPEGAESCPGLHHPKFDFNDDALAMGIEAMVTLATT